MGLPIELSFWIGRYLARLILAVLHDGVSQKSTVTVLQQQTTSICRGATATHQTVSIGSRGVLFCDFQDQRLHWRFENKDEGELPPQSLADHAKNQGRQQHSSSLLYF